MTEKEDLRQIKRFLVGLNLGLSHEKWATPVIDKTNSPSTKRVLISKEKLWLDTTYSKSSDDSRTLGTICELLALLGVCP